jgi:predicted Fe-Mo cluster-binding NifX family protein
MPIAVLEDTRGDGNTTPTMQQQEDIRMKIAIPVANGKLSVHFGHCAHFALIDIDAADKKILQRQDIEAPPHAPGLLPPWLAERGVTVIIAGGMGQRAQGMFSEHGIEVLVGAPPESPEHLVAGFLAGTLQTGANVCDH